jgi:uncharacterized membrane protein YozB (DUF420 family)
MSILGTQAGLMADLAIIVQTSAFVILVSGVIYIKKKNYQRHVNLADIAVFLGILSFLWMGFSFISNFQLLISNISVSVNLIAIIHAITGLIVLITGIFFATNRYIKKTRNNMRMVFLLWAVAFFLGFELYIMYYTY